MPRNYQRTKNNPYLLPHNLYMRVLYIIKDYDRLKDEYQTILDSGGSAMGGRRAGSGTSNPTENKAIRLAAISDELHAIEGALIEIPQEYRQGVLSAIKYRTPYPDTAGYKTWQRWRQRFIWHVAKNMRIV